MMLRFVLSIACCLSASVISHGQDAKHEHHSDHHHEHHHKTDLPLASGDLPGKSLYHLEGQWTNQDGKQITLASLAGKPRVLTMGFTACKTACPLLVGKLKSIESAFSPEERKSLGFHLFSIDPVADTPQQLRSYMEKMRLDPKRWEMFRSDQGIIRELAAALNIQIKPLQSGDYIHSNVVYLIGSDGVVVAKDEGLKPPSETFLQEVKELVRKTSTN